MSNASGSWTNIGTNSSVFNGTYSQTPSGMDSYDTIYYWSVNVTDGLFWTNETYIFTTEINSSPQITNIATGDKTVQVISQQAEALQPGTFTSGASVLEGYVYSTSVSGEKVRESPLLRAVAPDVKVEVLPFPTHEKPDSFNGAVGIFHWQVSLLGSNTVLEGEKLMLQCFVSGQGDIDSVQLPDIQNQKGFKDAFSMSDILPVGKKED